jgi:hypothetical protein
MSRDLTPKFGVLREVLYELLTHEIRAAPTGQNITARN